MLSRSLLLNKDMCKKQALLTFIILVVLLIHASIGQDIAFPSERPTDVLEKEHVTGKPTSPAPEIKCKENMILVELNATENFCECVEGYLYYPKLDKCYKPYARGPCDEGKYFLLRENEEMAKCVRNPCGAENEVPYKGSCYGLLLSDGPCPEGETLVVSEKSNEPACESVKTITYQVITVPVKACAPGSRRAGRGLCRTIL